MGKPILIRKQWFTIQFMSVGRILRRRAGEASRSGNLCKCAAGGAPPPPRAQPATMPARRCLLVPPLQPPSPTATTGASSGDSRHVPFDGALLLPPPPGASLHSRRPSTARFPGDLRSRFSRLRRELKPMVTCNEILGSFTQTAVSSCWLKLGRRFAGWPNHLSTMFSWMGPTLVWLVVHSSYQLRVLADKSFLQLEGRIASMLTQPYTE